MHCLNASDPTPGFLPSSIAQSQTQIQSKFPADIMHIYRSLPIMASLQDIQEEGAWFKIDDLFDSLVNTSYSDKNKYKMAYREVRYNTGLVQCACCELSSSLAAVIPYARPYTCHRATLLNLLMQDIEDGPAVRSFTLANEEFSCSSDAIHNHCCPVT